MIKLRPLVKKAVIIVAVLTMAVVLLFRYFAEPPPPPVSVSPSVQLLESRLVGRKDGFRQWEIWTQAVLQTGDVVTLTDLEEISIFQAEEAYLFIDAETAVWDRKLDILHLHASKVRDEEGDFYLESDLLIWAGTNETLTSPGPVFILWQDLEIRAAEMVLESTTNLLYLKDDVQILDGSMVWRTDSAIYDLDRESIDFYGILVLEEEAGNEQEID